MFPKQRAGGKYFGLALLLPINVLRVPPISQDQLEAYKEARETFSRGLLSGAQDPVEKVRGWIWRDFDVHSPFLPPEFRTNGERSPGD